jgi:low temperature requirement protein LtrA
MVIGLTALTTSADMVISQPTRTAPGSWVAVIVGGPGLFLAGHALLGRRIFARVAAPRLIGVGILIAAGPALVGLPVLAVTSVVAAVLIALVGWDLKYSGTKPGDQGLGRRV